MLESPLRHRLCAVECLGLRSAFALRLSLLGFIECACHSHSLVAGRQALVIQHSLATIPFCPVGIPSISGPVDTNPRQLAQKGSLPCRTLQFHCRLHSYLIRKGHSRTLFISSSLPNFPQTAKVEERFLRSYSRIYPRTTQAVRRCARIIQFHPS